MSPPLSAQQLRALEIVERSASALSALGILVIVVTFYSSRYFRNPIDRLILLNAFFNIFDVTATFISLSGPSAGNGSGLCQFQGFLMQMFPLADVLWTLAMAVDVFLIVFKQYDAPALRRLEIRYVLGIGIGTFIPALVFLFVRTPSKGPMYGSVTLWCAIAPEWVLYRIVFYYVPIWAAIFVVLVLYILVGWKIVEGKRALRSVEGDVAIALETRSSEKDQDSTTTTTTATTAHDSALARRGLPPQSLDLDLDLDGGAGAVVARSTRSRESTSALRPQNSDAADIAAADAAAADAALVVDPAVLLSQSRAWQANRSALSLRQYLLMPVMFFVVLLAIWVAPTTNRVASFVHPGFGSFPLYLAVGATGSLRGFWNGVVFLAVGMRSRQSQKQLEQKRPARLVY